MQRKTFGQSIVDYNNKRLRGAANAHDRLIKINDQNERYEGMKNELHELSDTKEKLKTPLTIHSSSDVTFSDSIIQH